MSQAKGNAAMSTWLAQLQSHNYKQDLSSDDLQVPQYPHQGCSLDSASRYVRKKARRFNLGVGLTYTILSDPGI